MKNEDRQAAPPDYAFILWRLLKKNI